ncbi:uncharacterized protein LOC110099897 [Dendrobium catenatum]|uniref:uncharacterized protein LOC110099897 n=1 Tax=Dendrobium catenatum TaxID=906689 RepID=UPI0009F4AFA9|nr:uncharacterized protein LOC110099897 [Dendrobium catenatum]
MNSEQEIANSKILSNSIILKVLGKNIPFSICSIELHKQWNRFGNFHLTSLGLNWILFSFKPNDVMEEFLSGGPWYIGGHIVGLDKWLPSFSPLSLKGLTVPVWIRFPLFPLNCWDEVNIARIALRIGTPMFLDGNSLNWSKKEFARIYVRVNLESKLPSGVWVDGLGGHFFQKVEYKKLSSFCFHCSRIGHLESNCPERVFKKATHNDPTDTVNQETSHSSI